MRDEVSAHGYVPGLLDRLMDAPVRGASSTSMSRMSIEDIKDSVARDLEALLNTRSALPDGLFKGFPEAWRSLASYGLQDFAGRSLMSYDDRVYVCACLEDAVNRHEPRLRNVRATLELRGGTTVNCLNFSITAMLVLNTAQEPVNFDAVLQPSSQHYTISKAGRPG